MTSLRSVGPLHTRLFVLASLSLGASAQTGTSPSLDQVLARHMASIGGEDKLRHADIFLAGSARASGAQFKVRIMVRREPFAYREEWHPLLDRPAAAPARAFLSDGRHVWTPQGGLFDPNKPGVPLAGANAVSVLQYAFIEGLLYLDPRWTHGGAGVGPRWSLPRWPGLPDSLEPDVDVDPAHFHTPAGTLLQFQFDAKDGRLHEVAQPENVPTWFIRYGRWQKFGDLWLPALRLSGYHDRRFKPDLDVFELEEVRLGVDHPDALFAGNPAQVLPSVLDAGPLRVLPHTVPGTAHVMMLDCTVNATAPITALLDTGATLCGIEPAFAAATALPILGRQGVATAVGVAEHHARWIDQLTFGDRRVLQLPVGCLSQPAIFQVPRDQAPQLLFGGAELFEASPVLDLEAGRLWLRGRPVKRLAEMPRQKDSVDGAGKRIVTIPFARRRERGDTIDIEIEVGGKRVAAMLDTGFWAPLRLHADGLAAVGLPVDMAEWQKRGALLTTSAAAGGEARQELLVVLPEIRLGPIAYEKPIVQVSPIKAVAARTPIVAIVGAGALLPCARVGIDDQRQLLELELRDDIAATDDGTWRVPAAGLPLGFAINSPLASAKTEPECLPTVVEVAPGSPAERAGLRVGDRIVAIDGIPCACQPAALINRSFWLRDGKHVEIGVRASDGVRQVTLP